MNRTMRWLLKPFKSMIERWLFERALYIPDEELTRLAGGNKSLEHALRLVYAALRGRVEREWRRWWGEGASEPSERFR